MSFTKAPISAVITDAIGNTINLGNASGAFTAAPVSIVLTDANGNTLNVGAGVVAKVDATAQQANIGVTTLYAVPAGQGGMYRAHCYVVVTQAATTSSTMPAVQINYTDADTSVVANMAATQTSTSNAIGVNSSTWPAVGQQSNPINVKAGTNITYQTTSYASSGATPMQYAVHVRLEYIGA